MFNTRLCEMLKIEKTVTAASPFVDQWLRRKKHNDLPPFWAPGSMNPLPIRFYVTSMWLSKQLHHFLCALLRKFVNDSQNNWDIFFLDATLFLLRPKVHTTTKHTPFQQMSGREAGFSAEIPVELSLSVWSPLCTISVSRNFSHFQVKVTLLASPLLTSACVPPSNRFLHFLFCLSSVPVLRLVFLSILHQTGPPSTLLKQPSPAVRPPCRHSVGKPPLPASLPAAAWASVNIQRGLPAVRVRS